MASSITREILVSALKFLLLQEACEGWEGKSQDTREGVRCLPGPSLVLLPLRLATWTALLPPGESQDSHLVPVTRQCHYFPGESGCSPSRVSPVFSTLGY